MVLRDSVVVARGGPLFQWDGAEAAPDTRIFLVQSLLAGCGPSGELPPVTSAPRTPAVCEALRPDMPIRYSGKGDTPDTVKQVRAVNARFAAACP